MGNLSSSETIAAAQASPAGEWICRPFASALGERDVSAAVAAFSEDACLVTRDATVIRGREPIRLVLDQLVARSTEIRLEFSNVLVSGGVALAQERWVVRANGIEGSSFEQVWTPTLVLRRIENSWKLAVAAPWGWGYRFTT